MANGTLAATVIAVGRRGLMVAAIATSVPAQELPEPSPPAATSTPLWSGIEFWGGIASGSPRLGVLGRVPDMNFGLIAVRFSRPIGMRAGGRPASRLTEFTVELVPFATMSPPYISLRGTGIPCARGKLCVLPPTSGPQQGVLFPAGSAHGFGLNPAGVTTRFRRERLVSPWLGIVVGGLWFDKHVPTTQSSQFNFTAAFEAGVRLGPPRAPGLTMSYRFHHISNAGTAGENPGLASQLVTLGIHGWRRGR